MGARLVDQSLFYYLCIRINPDSNLCRRIPTNRHYTSWWATVSRSIIPVVPLLIYYSAEDTGNTYWGGDRTIPSPRPIYQINGTEPGTDVAAQVSAAFAACSNLYANRGFDSGKFSSPASLTDEKYAETLLTHAEQLYSFALNATGGRKVYQKSVPEVAAAYESHDFGDELAVAALFLSWAKQDASHFVEAEGYYDRYKLADSNRVFNWDSKVPGLAVLFSQIAQSQPNVGGNLDHWKALAEKYFDTIANKKKPSFQTPGTSFALDIPSPQAHMTS